MHQLSVRTRPLEGGISPKEWYDAFLPKTTFSGSINLTAYTSANQTITMPRGKCGLVLTNLRTFHGTDPPCVIGTPKASLVVFCEALPATDGLILHPLVKKGDLVIPMGDVKSEEDFIVVMDLSVRLLAKNDRLFHPHVHHVCNAYMSSLQSLAWQISNEENKSSLTCHISAFLALLKAASAWFIREPRAFEQVIAPLAEMSTVYDNIQRSLALVFVKQPLTSEQMARLLELMLRRYVKHLRVGDEEMQIEGAAEVDFRRKFIYGFTTALVFIPQLQEYVHDTEYDEKKFAPYVSMLQSRYEAMMESLLGVLTEMKDSPRESVNKQVLYRLVQFCPQLAQVRKAQIDLLYDFCVDEKSPGLAPLARWGFIPITRHPFDYLIRSRRDHKVTVNENQLSIEAKYDHCAIELLENGKYLVQPKLVRIFRPGKFESFLATNASMHFGINTSKWVSRIGAWAYPSESAGRKVVKTRVRGRRRPLDSPSVYSLDFRRFYVQVGDLEFSVIDSQNNLWYHAKKHCTQEVVLTFAGMTLKLEKVKPKGPPLDAAEATPIAKIKHIPL